MTVYSPTPAPTATHGQASNMQVLYASIAVTAALTTADTFTFGFLPANARVHVAILKGTDMDTGSPTLTFSVGDAASATRYFTASTVGQAGTVDAAINAGGRLFKTSAKTAIVGAVPTGPATGVAGTLELAIHYVVEDSPTSP